VTERQSHGAYRDVADLARRVRLGRKHLETLAAAGALASLGVSRRQALWSAGVLADEHGRPHLGHRTGGDRTPWCQPPLPGTAVGSRAPDLPEMSAQERHVADLRLTGVSTETHPLAFLRTALAEDGVVEVVRVGQQGNGATGACGWGCHSPSASVHGCRDRLPQH